MYYREMTAGQPNSSSSMLTLLKLTLRLVHDLRPMCDVELLSTDRVFYSFKVTVCIG